MLAAALEALHGQPWSPRASSAVGRFASPLASVNTSSTPTRTPAWQLSAAAFRRVAPTSRACIVSLCRCSSALRLFAPLPSPPPSPPLCQKARVALSSSPPLYVISTSPVTSSPVPQFPSPPLRHLPHCSLTPSLLVQSVLRFSPPKHLS